MFSSSCYQMQVLQIQCRVLKQETHCHCCHWFKQSHTHWLCGCSNSYTDAVQVLPLTGHEGKETWGWYRVMFSLVWWTRCVCNIVWAVLTTPRERVWSEPRGNWNQWWNKPSSLFESFSVALLFLKETSVHIFRFSFFPTLKTEQHSRRSRSLASCRDTARLLSCPFLHQLHQHNFVTLHRWLWLHQCWNDAGHVHVVGVAVAVLVH